MEFPNPNNQNHVFPYQEPSQNNLKFPISSTQTQPPHIYIDPFLAPKFSTPLSHNQSSLVNKNALVSSNAVSYAHFVNLPPNTYKSTLPPNQFQLSGVNFQDFGSSSGSVNRCMAVNSHGSDHRGSNSNGGDQRMCRNSVKGHWNQEEDRKLVQLVERYGNKRWSYIAQMMPGRLGKQLRERYNNHLRPGLKKEAWAEEEDLQLIEDHEELGNKWAEIARRLPGRSESDIKNRWNATRRKCLNAIKKSRTNPKPSSLFENYVRNILIEREASSTLTGESNERGGPSSNGSNGPDSSIHNRNGSHNVDDGSVGLHSSSGPSAWTGDNCTITNFEFLDTNWTWSVAAANRAYS